MLDKERELEVWANLIYIYAKEKLENDSVATRWIFDRATHDEWVLSLFPKHLASEKAYNQFFELTGKDIRDFDWNSLVRTKSGEKIVVHQYFVDEHLTTAYDFKNEILWLYKNKELTVEKIKKLISFQRLCWITKEENSMLSKKGYIKHRSDPLKAYKNCDISIYDAENENLEDIMKPTFNRNDFINIDNKEQKDFSIHDNINKLKEYYEKKLINGKKYTLRFYPNEAYAWIYNQRGFMINIRIKSGMLKDISLYLYGPKAKNRFARLLLYKNKIESMLGYELVWDKNENKKASRIGRFFKDADLSSEIELENKYKCFNFNVNSENYIEQTAKEMAKFYDVFIPFIEIIDD